MLIKPLNCIIYALFGKAYQFVENISVELLSLLIFYFYSSNIPKFRCGNLVIYEMSSKISRLKLYSPRKNTNND